MEWPLPAEADVLYRHFTEPDLLQSWYWPPALGTQVSLDVHPGGTWRISSEAAGIAVSGSYSLVRPGEQLDFSWQWRGEEAMTSVSLRFSDGRLGLEHSGFADPESVALHRQGWNDCVGRLAGLLERG